MFLILSERVKRNIGFFWFIIIGHVNTQKGLDLNLPLIFQFLKSG